MKRIIFLMVMLGFIAVSLLGCGDDDADMDGIVLETTKNGITLAREMSPDEYENIKHESVTDLQNEDVEGEQDLGLIDLFYDDKDELNKGDEVNVWIDGDIMDSYPPQADVKKITIKK